ncbi:NAD(P)-dependent oxidoreductase [Gudongella oleilytica]|uniref:NAD(P)-dependent oxidoreductase n=1 Tax=Gudongella oleilytica TaxID=1582259 RepID=UPI002A3692F3|nr:NAD(P)-dependent oxidoreductase [Gudongella oleilytica]MDY0257690.1 NAD(P)-dependent oxidoreductase [Gudongella oleilytica]
MTANNKPSILCTAETGDLIRTLDDFAKIEFKGWAEEQRILTEEELCSLMEAYQPDILITSYDPVTRKAIDSSKNLKLVICTRANPVNVDTGYLKEKGIPLSYSPERNSDCTAEYTVAMMLSIMRRIPMAYHDLKKGLHTVEEARDNEIREGLKRDVTWALGKDTPYIQYKGYQMKGRTLGVVGYGSIGRRVASICRSFGMKIIVFDPYLDKNAFEDVYFTDTLLELANKADVVSVHSKDSPSTYHIIDKEFLDNMKTGSFFINTSRGALVDEAALVEALREGRIMGAALDVFETEPIRRDHPFLGELENCVVTPHLAGATYDAIDNHTDQLVRDVLHFINGEELEFEYT